MNIIPQPSSLYFIHGGAAEDFIIPFILKKSSQWKLKAIFVMSGDSHGPTAFQVVKKIERYLSSCPIESELCQARVQNSFPWNWRADSLKINEIDEFKDFSVPYSRGKGEELLATLLSQEKDNAATLLITGPWTPIHTVLKNNFELISKIRQIICMAGAFEKGNIFPEVVGGLSRPLSEWNLWADPEAVEWVLENTNLPIAKRIIPIILLPIDTCNELEVRESFLAELEKQGESKFEHLSSLAYKIYSLAVEGSMINTEAANGTIKKESTYRFWNTLITFYLIHPQLFDPPQSMSVKIITNSFHQWEGALISDPKGRKIEVLKKIKHVDQFYNKLLESLKNS